MKDLFNHELRALWSLDHPNVCGLRGFGRRDGVEGQYFLVLEPVTFRSLRSVIQCFSPLGVGALASVIRDVVEAVAYLHSNKIIHHGPCLCSTSCEWRVCTYFGAQCVLLYGSRWLYSRRGFSQP